MTKRILSLSLALAMLCTMFTICCLPVGAASLPPMCTKSTLTGRVTDGWGGALHVYTTGSAAKLRICTFNQNNKRTSGKLVVEAKADSGARWTWSITGCNGISNNTTNVTLPAGNTHYVIRIRRDGTSNTNRTNTFYYSIDYKKNCARPW